jgi:hypothetical protein
MELHNPPFLAWTLVAPFVPDPDDLCSLRLVCTLAHAAIPKPPSPRALAIRRLLCAQGNGKDKRGSFVVSFHAGGKSIQIRFDEDNRDPERQKTSIWYEHKMLGVHRYDRGTDAEYFDADKIKWVQIVPNPRHLKLVNAILQDTEKVTMNYAYICSQLERIHNWLTTDWSEIKRALDYRVFY